MFVYREIYSGEDPKLCQEMNLNNPSSSLNKAREEDVPFVFLSRFSVFDMNRNLEYHELSKRNGESTSGKMISIMEDYVLDYEKGFVIRVDCFLDDMIEEVRDMMEKENRVQERRRYPVAAPVLNRVIELLDDRDWGNIKKIVHIPIPEESSGLMAFRMKSGGGHVDISYDEISELENYKGASIISRNFERVFGATEKATCEYANQYYVRVMANEIV